MSRAARVVIPQQRTPPRETAKGAAAEPLIIGRRRELFVHSDSEAGDGHAYGSHEGEYLLRTPSHRPK